MGYTLVETAGVLLIAAVILVLSLNTIKSQYEVNSYNGVKSKLETVKIALARYKAKFGRLPCPADRTLAGSSATYLQEVASCTTEICSTGITCPSNVAIGAIPTKTLGLGDVLAIDAWDKKFVYAVDQRFTRQYSSNCQVDGKIIIVDNYNNALNANGSAEFVIASLGKNGLGAYKAQGGLASSCNTSYAEGENCNDDRTFKDGKYSDGINNNYYDDIVVWNPNHNSMTCPAGVTDCKIWLDAADVCSVDYNSSGVVNSWQDKSASNFIANAVTAPSYVTTTSNLTNGNPYLLFSSASVNLLSISNLSATTAFPTTNFSEIIVFLPITLTAGAVSNAASTNTYSAATQDRIFGINSSGYSLFNMAGANVTDTSAVSLSIPTIATITVSSSSGQTLYVNGTQSITSATTTSTFSSPSNFNIGGASNLGAFNGRILEIIFYSRVLSSGERQQIETYLAQKWGVVY
jgi:competence protein ComGC